MLPFLKAQKDKSVAGLIIKTRAPDQKPEQDQEDDSSAAIDSCAHDLIQAVHAKDVKGVSEAIKAAFEILESMPHDEASDSPSPHTYDAQNQAAGENE